MTYMATCVDRRTETTKEGEEKKTPSSLGAHLHVDRHAGHAVAQVVLLVVLAVLIALVATVLACNTARVAVPLHLSKHKMDTPQSSMQSKQEWQAVQAQRRGLSHCLTNAKGVYVERERIKTAQRFIAPGRWSPLIALLNCAIWLPPAPPSWPPGPPW